MQALSEIQRENDQVHTLIETLVKGSIPKDAMVAFANARTCRLTVFRSLRWRIAVL